MPVVNLKNVVPTQITPNGNGAMAMNAGFNSIYQLTSASGPNGVNVSIGYDATTARPANSKGPHGAWTYFSYSNTAPHKTATTGQRWVKETYDGLGRTIKVQTGYDATTVSTVETEYDSCGCSPLGKVKRVSRPYAPGGTVYWTVYSYDSQGRAISVAQPNNRGTSTYSYAGNTSTVTGPSGKWKKSPLCV